jgi:hypothetical protein
MAAVPDPLSYPTPDEVVEISAIRDNISRNLQITECYHRLSLAMAERVGGFANWCTFATWASRQAGSTIRGEDFLTHLSAHARPGWTALHPVQSLWRALLRAGILSPETAIGRLVRAIHSPFDAFERASEAVARGNLKVFQEIAFEFARYLRNCPAASPPESDELAGFLSGLRPGAPPDGQDLLRQAFLLYQRQASAPSADAGAQRMLLANLVIGLHEQTRLQPEIQAALEVLPLTAEDLTARVLQVVSPGRRNFAALLRPLPLLTAGFRRFAREITRRAITDSLMVLELPEASLSLGRHLDAPFPEALLSLTEPGLVDLCNRYEPLDGACVDCGARDWAELAQRMHYILHLFRAFLLDDRLMQPPFTPTQTDLLRLGEIPGGDL